MYNREEMRRAIEKAILKRTISASHGDVEYLIDTIESQLGVEKECTCDAEFQIVREDLKLHERNCPIYQPPVKDLPKLPELPSFIVSNALSSEGKALKSLLNYLAELNQYLRAQQNQ